MCFTVGYYNHVKDYLHPRLHKFINYYKDGNTFDLLLFYSCNKKKRRNGTRKLIEYDQGYQCKFPTDKPHWRKTKKKYKHGTITEKRQYWTRYMIDVCSKTKKTLFIIVSLRSLNICLKHHAI